MSYHYTRLTAAEVAKLQQLRTVFAAAFPEEATWQGPAPSAAYLAEVLDNPQYIALVATTADGQVVGGLSAYILPSIASATPEVYLYDVAVAAAHRRQGIATALIRELQAIAQSLGATGIFVQTEADTVEAVALYTALATSHEDNIMQFELPVQDS